MPYKIAEIIRNSTLKPAISKRILCELLSCSFEELFLRQNECLKASEFERFSGVVERFSAGEPLEYIFGHASFMGREFMVDKNVLIPRDETEILVLKAAQVAKSIENPLIFDVCSGSGIIAISLALMLENARIIASDISEPALNIAWQNAKKLGAKVEFVKSDLLENLPPKADIIVSNPPYISQDYKLDIWVSSEPHLALFGGEKGDELLKRLINESKTRTKYLLCEMGYDQKNSLKAELENAGFKAQFYTDLAGFDRGFVAKI